MRFVIIRRADAETEAGAAPSEELFAAMMKYNEELADAGAFLGGDGLQPTSRGALVRFSGGRPTVTDGPFTEAKELVAGFTLIEAASKEEAIEWAKRWPPLDGNGEVELEIRQVYEAEDFAAADPTGELRQTVERLRGRAAEQR
ncbi:MAG TPA: YciI family protein [Longimicrobium sp.]|jgi:hypothetical protein